MCLVGTTEQLSHYLRHRYQCYQTRDGFLEADKLGHLISGFPFPEPLFLCFWCTHYPYLCDTDPSDCLCQSWVGVTYFQGRAIPGHFYCLADSQCFTRHCDSHGGKHGRTDH